MEIKKGQTVWVWTSRGVEETTVNSVGKKYITLNCDVRIKFDSETLRKVNSTGFGSFIILDLEEYNEDKRYRSIKQTLSKFAWDSMEREDLDKVMTIIRDYE